MLSVHMPHRSNHPAMLSAAAFPVVLFCIVRGLRFWNNDMPAVLSGTLVLCGKAVPLKQSWAS